MDVSKKKTYNLLACVKQVPDERELGTDPETGSLLRANAGSIPNPADGDSLELANQVKEKLEELDSTISTTALTMGPPASRASLRQALALGFDRAIQLRDTEFAGSDVLMTAKTLAMAIKSLDEKPDLVFCGEYSSDGDTGQVPGELSVFLGYNYLAHVREIIAIEDDRLRAYIEEDFMTKEVEAKLPLVIQVKSSSQKPRFASFRDRMEAKKKPLEIWTKDDLKAFDEVREFGYDGSPTKIRRMSAPVFDRPAIKLNLEAYPDFPKKIFYSEDPQAYLDDFIKSLEKDGKSLDEKSERTISSTPREELPPEESLAIIAIKHQKEDFIHSLELISKLQSLGDFPIEIVSFKDSSCQDYQGRKDLEKKILANVDKWKIYHSEILLSSMDISQIIYKKAKEKEPTLLILPATDWGRDVGPLVASRLQTGMTAAVTDIDYKEDHWEQVRPAYGGMVLATVLTPDHLPIMMTVQSNVFEIDLKNNRKASFEKELIKEDQDRPVKVLSAKKTQSEDLELDQKELLMVLGGGITDEEGLKSFTDLCEDTDFEWAVSRALVMGYLADHQRQVGVSGISVKPGIALLIGVSGTSQTMSGLNQSGITVAINSDPSAKIFDQVDLGFVGEYQEFLKYLENQDRNL